MFMFVVLRGKWKNKKIEDSELLLTLYLPKVKKLNLIDEGLKTWKNTTNHL